MDNHIPQNKSHPPTSPAIVSAYTFAIYIDSISYVKYLFIRNLIELRLDINLYFL